MDGPVFVGEFAGVEFGVDDVIANFQLEAPTTVWDERHIFDFRFIFVEQLARQTDGLGSVVSLGTVFQFHIHRNHLSCEKVSESDRLNSYRYSWAET